MSGKRAIVFGVGILLSANIVAGADTGLGRAKAEGGSSITGQVLVEGDGPLKEAEVYAVPHPLKLGENPAVATARADAEGKYCLEGLAPGTYEVQISDLFEKWHHSSHFYIRVEAGKVYTHDLVAVPLAFLSGQVVEEKTGKPLRDVRVDCVIVKPDGTGSSSPSTHTNREGRFRFLNRPGRAEVYVWVPLRYGLTPPLNRRYAFRGPLQLQPGETKFHFRYNAERLNQPLPTPEPRKSHAVESSD